MPIHMMGKAYFSNFYVRHKYNYTLSHFKNHGLLIDIIGFPSGFANSEKNGSLKDVPTKTNRTDHRLICYTDSQTHRRVVDKFFIYGIKVCKAFAVPGPRVSPINRTRQKNTFTEFQAIVTMNKKSYVSGKRRGLMPKNDR